MVVNTFLAGACWGKVAAGNWEWSAVTLSGSLQLACPEDAELSYYKYLEGCMADKPRSEFKKAVGSFSELHEQFRKVADQMVSALLAPEALWETPFAFQQNGTWYHFVFPSVWKLLASLQAEGRQVSVIVRTFGTDGPEIAKAISAFAEGKHPDYPNGCPQLRLAGFHQGTLNLDEASGMRLCLESEAGELNTLQGEVPIFSHMDALQGTLVLRDDYAWWANQNYAGSAGKPFWLLKSHLGAPHHIFFDDNFRPDMPANSIIDARGMALLKDGFEAQGSIDARVAEQAGCAHAANLANCVLDADHYTEVVRQLESKWAKSSFVAAL